VTTDRTLKILIGLLIAIIIVNATSLVIRLLPRVHTFSDERADSTVAAGDSARDASSARPSAAVEPIDSERGTAVEPGGLGANLSGASGAPLAASAPRDYPTLTLEPTASGPVPGYERWYTTWSAIAIDSVSYNKYRTPTFIAHHVCTVAGGMAVHDYPIAGPPVSMLVFLGGRPCRTNCHEMWAVHRGETADWRNYVGTAIYRPGQPRTLPLYPAHGEILNVRCTWRSP
jgi:hypothetical protein